MGKRVVYTKITPLPSNVPRQLALDMLHSHEEVIKLNPLVTGVAHIDAPRDARSDEFFSQWYEISEIITWGFGLKKKIAFKGVFHSQPWGLQSHVYAPMGVDMRNKYRIGGNQPGEPREARELGVNTPLDGLYLREDVDIMCNVPLTASFVKKEAQSATAIMVDRLTRKAELLDEGKLHAMFEDGMLKTSKPSSDPTFSDQPLPSPTSLPGSHPPSEPSPGLNRQSTYGTLATPTVDSKGFGRYSDIVGRTPSQSNRSSAYVPQYQQSGYQGPDYARPGAELPGVPELAEMPGSFYQPEQQSPGLYPPPLKSQGGQGGQVFRAELPGDGMLMPPPGSANASPQPPQGGFQAYQQPPGSQQSGSPHSQQGGFQNGSPQPQQGGYQPYQQHTPQSTPSLPARQASNASSTYSAQGQYQIANPGPQQNQQQYPPQQQQQHPPQQQQQQQYPPQQQHQHPAYRQQSSSDINQLPSQQQGQHPAYRQSSHTSGQSDQIAAWQRGLNNISGDDPNSIRNSTPSGSFIEPDHQRFSQMSIQQTPESQHAQPVRNPQNGAPGGGGRVSKCPVCGLFEGDEAAISHHVSKAHFA